MPLRDLDAAWRLLRPLYAAYEEESGEAEQCGGDDSGPEENAPHEVPGPLNIKPELLDSTHVTFDADAVLVVDGKVVSRSSFPSGTGGRIAMDAGQSGTVHLDVKLHGVLDLSETKLEEVLGIGGFFDLIRDQLEKIGGSGIQTFDQSFRVSWDVTTDESGSATFGNARPSIGSHEGMTTMRLDSVNPDSQSGSPAAVQVSPKVVGVSVAVGGSAGVSGEVSTAPAYIQETFRLQLEVCAPKKGPKKVHRAHHVAFERVKQTVVSGSEESQLIRWYEGLSEAGRRRIEAGDECVTISGFASTTGSEQVNLALSTERAKNVERILASFAGSGVWFTTRGRGQYRADTSDGVEEDSERRVEVSVADGR